MATSALNRNQLFDELVSLIRGEVSRPGEQSFTERSRTFNGKLEPNPMLVVSPVDAEDVSKVVKFCVKHALSPSVIAGGYGIAGWAVAGDIVIDMSRIRELDIEAPVDAGDGTYQWTRLKDMPAIGSKGKGRVQPPPPVKPEVAAVTEAGRPVGQRSVSTKRRREDSPPTEHPTVTQGYARSGDDGHLRNYDAASQAVAEFLRGPPLPVEEGGEVPRQPPTNRRRLHSPTLGNNDVPHLDLPPATTRQLSGDSETSSGGASSLGLGERTLSGGTAASTPRDGTPKEGEEAQPTSAPSIPQPVSSDAGADPFGYMSLPSTTTPSMSSSTLMSHRSFTRAPTGAVSSSSASRARNIFNTGMPMSLSNIPSMLSGLPSMSGPFSMPPFGMPGLGGLANISAPARPVHTHAYLTVGAGTRQKEIDMFTAENPLEGISRITGEKENGLVPYHVPSSAHPVGSSIFILTGFGFLSRLHGLSIDNLLEVEMVLADGRIIIVSENENPELWWAVRGAGPAFGIATRYKLRAFPVPVVFAGNLIYRFHRATAPSLIKHFRDCIKGAPRELYANVLLTAGPADKDSLVVIQMCYLGPKEQGMEYLQAISSWDGERCLLNEVNEKSYLFQQDSIAQILRGKAGRQWFIRSSLIHSLPDEVIHKTVVQFANTPIGCTWIFELSGGAIADHEDTCLPKEQRESTWTVAALHQWDMGIDDPRCITTAEEWMQEIIKPVSVGGPFPTFLGRHEPPSRTMACYGKNWDRLAELKRKYDPECLFRNNFWPLDKHGNPIGELFNEPPSPTMM